MVVLFIFRCFVNDLFFKEYLYFKSRFREIVVFIVRNELLVFEFFFGGVDKFFFEVEFVEMVDIEMAFGLYREDRF